MKLNNYQELRKLWIDFWESHDYFLVASKKIVSEDSSLLFINSGISALKNYFLEQTNLPSRYLYNIQPCLRLNDLVNIGVTNRHNTLFEMLGHFSIGNCNKQQAIASAMDFLCNERWMGLKKDKIYVTVHKSDSESYKIWQQFIDPNRIIQNDNSENFWQIGKGPCGPNTEIFYKLTPGSGITDKSINLLIDNIENNIYLELWNIVFSEYDYQGNGKYKNLINKSVDVGAGLERLLIAWENKNNVFETSLFGPIVRQISQQKQRIGKEVEKRTIYRICDFIRAIIFIVASGIVPANKKHGYSLKKLIKMLLLELMKETLSFEHFRATIVYFVKQYAINYQYLNNINQELLEPTMNYAHTQWQKFTIFWKIYSATQKAAFAKQNTIQNYFDDNISRSKIYRGLAPMIIPAKRFENYNTFGTWQPEFKPLFKEVLQFLEIKRFTTYQFSMLMPPPNITGALHLGHAYELFIQDTVLREKKLANFNTIWFAGFDHGGIATNIKINDYISAIANNNQGSTKLTFLQHANIWKTQTQKKILQQWVANGFLINTKLINYTLDANSQYITDKVFELLLKHEYIYRDYLLVNYDPVLKTVISDVEISLRKHAATLYYVKYQIANTQKYLTIATSRPETIFADEYIAFNPHDPRFSVYRDASVINPLTKARIPIIADEAVDVKFGTGIMKVTPCHDFVDFAIGKKLPSTKYLQVIDVNQRMTNVGQIYNGLSILTCRNKVVKRLRELNLLEKTQNYTTVASFNTKTNHEVVPLLSAQWFVALKKMRHEFLLKYQNNLTDFDRSLFFYPRSTNKHMLTLLSKTNNWCISRQIPWGHRIPIAYKNGTNRQEFICTVNKQYDQSMYTLETDVFDTWFTSCLWPLITTRFLVDDDFFSKFFPISLLVTGYDILFIWVTRMVLLCHTVIRLYNHVNRQKYPLIPFKKVLVHGLIRDSKHRKMSKSNNNGIDPTNIIKMYGNDATRMFFLLEHKQSQDIQFQPSKITCWNEYLIKINSIGLFLRQYQVNNLLAALSSKTTSYIVDYFLSTFRRFVIKLNKQDYKFYQSNERIINNKKYLKILHFITTVFSSQFLEQAKFYLVHDANNPNKQIKQQIIGVLYSIFSELLILINPMCPLLSEYWFGQLNQQSVYHFKSILTPRRLHELIAFKIQLFTSDQLISISEVIVDVTDSLNNPENACILASLCKNMSSIHTQIFYNFSSSIEINWQIKIFFYSLLFAKKILPLHSTILITNQFIDYSQFQQLQKINLLYINKQQEQKQNKGFYCTFELLINKQVAAILKPDIHKAIKKAENEFLFLSKQGKSLQKHLHSVAKENVRKNFLAGKVKENYSKTATISNMLTILNRNWANDN